MLGLEKYAPKVIDYFLANSGGSGGGLGQLFGSKTTPQKDNTPLYIGGAILVVILIVILMKK